MIRVLQLVTQVNLASQSGSPGHVRELSIALARAGAEVTLIAGKAPVEIDRSDLDEHGVELVEYDYVDLKTFPQSLRYPSELLFGVQNAIGAVVGCCDPTVPTVLHAHHMPHSPLVAEIVDRHVSLPYLTTTHGSDLHEGELDEPYQRLLHANRYGAYLVGLNETMMARLLRYAGRAQLARIPGGVKLEAYEFNPQSARNGSAPKLLYVGRLLEEKGALELPAILDAVLGFEPRARLTIAGDGRARAELEAEVAARGLSDRVDVLGWIPRADAAALMRRATLLLFPSRWPEPFARVLLEAAAIGLPVVTRDVGGNGEILGRGYAGIVRAEAEAAELARAVDDLVASPARCDAMARAARTHVESSYSWDSIAERYLDLFAETMAIWAAAPRGEAACMSR
jgi:glycogen(starch) synthase